MDLPILAANMDTVCEEEMAVALARLGGVGIIHRFMPVDTQAKMVENVKEKIALTLLVLQLELTTMQLLEAGA